MAKKMKDVTDTNETMAKLGIENPETPGGEPLVETTGLPQEQEPQKVEEPDTSGEQQEIEGEKEVSSTQDTEGNLTEEETQRRTWQADADTAKAEKAKVEEQLRLAQEQNRQLMQVVTPFMDKYGQAQQGPVSETNEKPKPDYIVDGFYDAEKHANWQVKHDEWLLKTSESRMTDNMQRRQSEDSARQQVADVIKVFPEYINPLTGEPDMNRLERDLLSVTQGKSMLDLVRESKGIAAEKPARQDPLATPASVDAMQKNASRPQSVVDSPETEQEKKEVPEELKKINKTFGDIELPPDFDGIA